MSRAPVRDLVWEAIWNGHRAIAIGVCRGAIWPKVCRLPMLYAMTVAVSGRVLLLRRIVEDCLVRWRAWQEVRQGSWGGLLRKECGHGGAYDLRRDSRS